MDEIIKIVIAAVAGAVIAMIFRKSDSTTRNSALLSEKLTLAGVDQKVEDLKPRIIKVEDRIVDLEKQIPVILTKISHIEREVEDGQKALMSKLATLESNQNTMIPTVNKAMDYFTRYHKEMTDLFNNAIQQMKDAVAAMKK